MTFPLQRLSTSTGSKEPSYSVGFTAKIEVTFSLSGVDSVASLQEIWLIVAENTLSGFKNVSFGRFLCAASIKSCQMGAAQLRPSHVPFVSDPSTLPAQTTVVICGVYPAVQRSRGRICFFPPLLTSLLEVPVFAATGRSLSVSTLFQKSLGRLDASERIILIIYAAASETIDVPGLSENCSMRFHFLSVIFNIGFISFLYPPLANTLYACMSSIGFNSPVPIASVAP